MLGNFGACISSKVRARMNERSRWKFFSRSLSLTVYLHRCTCIAVRACVCERVIYFVYVRCVSQFGFKFSVCVREQARVIWIKMIACAALDRIDRSGCGRCVGAFLLSCVSAYEHYRWKTAAPNFSRIRSLVWPSSIEHNEKKEWKKNRRNNAAPNIALTVEYVCVQRLEEREKTKLDRNLKKFGLHVRIRNRIIYADKSK